MRENVGARNNKKLLKKSSWFKHQKPGMENQDAGEKEWKGIKNKKKKFEKTCEKKEKPPVTVLFVPRTPGGKLATMLREAEVEMSKFLGDRIKIVERSGTKLKQLFHKSNPWSGENCQRDGCLVCWSGQERGGDCRRRNVVYRTSCLACRANGKESSYYGESSRTAFERGLEHARDFLTNQEDSHMYNHYVEEHHLEKKEGIKFEMKILKNHFSAVSRQVHEAVVIRRGSKAGINILNSKFEYSRCILPTLSVKMGEYEAQDVKEKKRFEEEITEVQEEIEVGKWKESKKRMNCEERSEANLPREKKRRVWKIENSRKRKNDENPENEESNPGRENCPHQLKRRKHDSTQNDDNLTFNSEHSKTNLPKRINTLPQFVQASNEKTQAKPQNEILSHPVNQEGNASTANNEYKANPSPASVNHHQHSNIKIKGLKRPNKPRRSKQVEPPSHYNYRRISDHFKIMTPPYTEENETSGKTIRSQATTKDCG